MGHYDTNGDRQFSLEEIEAGSEEHESAKKHVKRSKKFAKRSAPKPVALDEKEDREFFAAADVNGDGFMTMAEYRDFMVNVLN